MMEIDIDDLDDLLAESTPVELNEASPLHRPADATVDMTKRK